MKKLKFLICFMFTLILLFQQTDVVEAKGDSVSQDIIGTGNYGDNLTWILYNDGTLIISGEGDMEGYFDMSYYYKSEVKNVVIESGVTSIAGMGFYCFDYLESITIPSSVKSIGNSAFALCSSLKEIVIPEGVEEIGDEAFYYCEKLERVTIPSSVKSIGNSVFLNCSSLNEIQVNEENAYFTSDENSILYNKKKTMLLLIPSGLKEVAIPEGVKEIGDEAFYKCEELERVTIPGSVKKIGEAAFSKCNSLKGIWVKATNAYFSSDKKGVLYDKKKTTLISSPPELKGEYKIPDSVQCIGKEAFSNSKLESIVIPNSVKTIEKKAFHSCDKLKEIVISNSVTEIGRNAFGDCDRLESVTFGRNISKLGDSLFGEFVGDEGDDDIECVIKKIKFLGKAPKFSDDSFPPRDIICYYPKNNSSWTKSVRKDYGGDITWKGYEGTRYAPTIEVSNISSSGKIKIIWSHSNGAAKYKVYRATSKNGSYKLLGTTKGTVFTNTSATIGKTYYYYVKAVDSKGNNVKKSNTVSKTCDLARPNVTAKLNSKGKPSLTWKKVSGASKYEVYRATSKDGKYSLLKTVKGTLFINTGAKKGTTYYYKVKAIHSKSSANSAYSTVVSIKSK